MPSPRLASSPRQTERFAEIARTVAERLDVPLAHVSLQIDDDQMTTLGCCLGGRIQSNFEFSLSESPCRFVLQDGQLFATADFQSRFPKAMVPRDIQSYFGVCFEVNGERVGVVAALDRKERELTSDEALVLEMFARIAAAELARERAEDRANDLAAALHQVADHLPGAAYSYSTKRDGTRTVHYMSSKIREILGDEGKHELESGLESGRQLIHEADRAGFAQAVESALEFGQTLDFEHRMRTANGEYRWFRSIARGTTADGEVHWSGLILDAHAPHLLAERFRALSEFVPGITYAYRVPEEGPPALVWLGKNVEELIPHDDFVVGDDADEFFRAILHDDDFPRFREAEAEARRSGEPLDLEVRVCSECGRSTWLRAIAQPQTLDDGSVLWSGLLVDVSERRAEEVKSANYADALMVANDALSVARTRLQSEAEETIRLLDRVGSALRGTLQTVTDYTSELRCHVTEKDQQIGLANRIDAQIDEARAMLELLERAVRRESDGPPHHRLGPEE